MVITLLVDLLIIKIYRYYGRTQKEVIENARESFPKNRAFDRTYNSMRSINNIASESTSVKAGAQQISGTQSLNRNLCSRLNNSNNSASQSPRVMHASRSIQPNATKSETLRSHDTTISCNSHIIDTTPATSLNCIDSQTINNKNENELLNENLAINNNKVKENQIIMMQKYNSIDNDSSTHGSRTIDSRFSRDRFLADEENNNESDSNTNSNDDIDNVNEDDNLKLSSSFNKLPKFKQQEKLKNNIEQINNALKKELLLNNNNNMPQTPPLPVNKIIANETKSQQGSPMKNQTQQQSSQQQAIANNMNKIYSRKEVITIKEETKNIHHEELTTQETIYSESPYYISPLQETQKERMKFYSSYDQHLNQAYHQQQEQLTNSARGLSKDNDVKDLPPVPPPKLNKIIFNDADDDDGKTKFYFNTINNNKSSLNAILMPIKYQSLLFADLSSSSTNTTYSCHSTISKNSLLLSSSINFSSSASPSNPSTSSSSSSSSSTSSISGLVSFNLKPKILAKNQISKRGFNGITPKKRKALKSLPRFRKYIEIIDTSKLPAVNSISYKDDTIPDSHENDIKLKKWTTLLDSINASINDYKEIAARLNLLVEFDQVLLKNKKESNKDHVIFNDDDNDDDDDEDFREIDFSDDIDEMTKRKVNTASVSSLSSLTLYSPIEFKPQIEFQEKAES